MNMESFVKKENIKDIINKVIGEAEKLEISEGDRNEKGELLVYPGGPVSNLGKQSELWWKITRTENFKKWFGDWQKNPKSSSKIIDKNGEPLALFRGLNKDISLDDFYDKDKYKKSQNASGMGTGINTTPSKSIASNFGSLGGIYPMFVNSKKPLYDSDSVKRVLKPIFRHDSVFGEINQIDKSKAPIDYSSKNPQDRYQILVEDPNKVFLLPNPIDKNYKTAKEYSEEDQEIK